MEWRLNYPNHSASWSKKLVMCFSGGRPRERGEVIPRNPRSEKLASLNPSYLSMQSVASAKYNKGLHISDSIMSITPVHTLKFSFVLYNIAGNPTTLTWELFEGDWINHSLGNFPVVNVLNFIHKSYRPDLQHKCLVSHLLFIDTIYQIVKIPNI